MNVHIYIYILCIWMLIYTCSYIHIHMFIINYRALLQELTLSEKLSKHSKIQIIESFDVILINISILHEGPHQTLRYRCVCREGAELGRLWSPSPEGSAWGSWGCHTGQEEAQRGLPTLWLPNRDLWHSEGQSLLPERSHRTGGNGPKLLGRFRMDIRKNFSWKCQALEQAAWEVVVTISGGI